MKRSEGKYRRQCYGKPLGFEPQQVKGMRRREGRLREEGQSRRKCEEEKTKKVVEEGEGKVLGNRFSCFLVCEVEITCHCTEVLKNQWVKYVQST